MSKIDYIMSFDQPRKLWMRYSEHFVKYQIWIWDGMGFEVMTNGMMIQCSGKIELDILIWYCFINLKLLSGFSQSLTDFRVDAVIAKFWIASECRPVVGDCMVSSGRFVCQSQLPFVSQSLHLYVISACRYKMSILQMVSVHLQEGLHITMWVCRSWCQSCQRKFSH